MPDPLRVLFMDVLDIPDDYGFMFPELIELLQAAVPPLLQLG
jgi:predicted protein tyrosine phosphatase